MSRLAKYGAERAKKKRFIQMGLDEKEKTQKEFAEDIGVTPQTVSATLNGRLHSPIVLNGLRKLGIAEKYLCDPYAKKETRE